MSEDPPAGPQQAAKWRAARPLVEEFNNTITPHGVVQVVRGVTRSARGHADSALDLVFTSVPDKMSEARALVRAYSDHRLVLCTRYTKKIITSPRYIKKRSYKNFDEGAFLREVRNTSMMNVYMCGDASEAARLLSVNLNSVLDRMAPVRRIQVRHNFAPWVTPACKERMAARDSAQKKASESRSDADWTDYRRIRNSVTRMVSKAKLQWGRIKMQSCVSDPAACWKNVRSWLGWTSTSSPTRLYSGSQVESSPAKMAAIMNSYYIQKVADIRAALPPPSVDPLATLRRMHYGQNRIQPMRSVPKGFSTDYFI
jgi:hypothetical protein